MLNALLSLRLSVLLSSIVALATACSNDLPVVQPPMLPANAGRVNAPAAPSAQGTSSGAIATGMSERRGETGSFESAGTAAQLAAAGNGGAIALGTAGAAGTGGSDSQSSAGAASGAAGKGGAGGGAAAGAGGAAGSDSSDSLPVECREQFCFTVIECWLFLGPDCGYTECSNFRCQ